MSHINRTRTWDEQSMILPALVCQVLANACGDQVNVEPSAGRAETLHAEICPAIRVRPRQVPWIEGNRMTGRLLVVSFVDHGIDPLLIKPMDLVDRVTGVVLPEHMAGLPGVSMKLRTFEPAIVRNQMPNLPSYAAQYWAAAVTLGGDG